MAKKMDRWSGLAAVVGGVLLFMVTIVEIFAYGNAPVSEAMAHGVWIPASILFLVAFALITLGLVGLYTGQAEQAGRLGLVAFLTTFAGMLMAFGFAWTHTFLLPVLAAAFPDVLVTIMDTNPPAILIAGFLVAVILFDLGWLMFGVASLRGGVWPRGASVLMIIGAVLDFVFVFLDVSTGVNGIAGLVLVAAVAWMGATLWFERPSTATAPSTI